MLTGDLRGIRIGDSVTSLLIKLGQPQDKHISIFGFHWYVYNSNYHQYLQVGVTGEKVVALYTNAAYWKLTDHVKYGASTVSLQNFGAKNFGETYVALKDKILYTFYIDEIEGDKTVAVLLKDAEIYGDYDTEDTALSTSFEKQIFDITNVERLNRGISLLRWREDVSGVARRHSEDMMKQNYFDHINKQGQRGWDRAKQAGINYTTYGENIAMGQMNVFLVVSRWMNSHGHRKNILNDNFNGMGVGVTFAPNSLPYYTQNFIK